MPAGKFALMLVQGMYNRRKKGDKEPALAADKEGSEEASKDASSEEGEAMCDGCAE